jgi:hypothetical protein
VLSCPVFQQRSPSSYSTVFATMTEFYLLGL